MEKSENLTQLIQQITGILILDGGFAWSGRAVSSPEWPSPGPAPRHNSALEE